MHGNHISSMFFQDLQPSALFLFHFSHTWLQSRKQFGLQPPSKKKLDKLRVGMAYGVSRVGVSYDISKVGMAYQISEVGMIYGVSRVGVLYNVNMGIRCNSSRERQKMFYWGQRYIIIIIF